MLTKSRMAQVGTFNQRTFGRHGDRRLGTTEMIVIVVEDEEATGVATATGATPALDLMTDPEAEEVTQANIEVAVEAGVATITEVASVEVAAAMTIGAR